MNNKITFPELVEQVAQYANTSKRMSELFLKELFATISQSLIDGESVKVKGIGTFKLTEVSARKSVDVNTGEEIEIPGHKKLSFAPDKSMAEAINQPFMHFETEILDDDVTDAQLAAIDAEEKAAGNEDSTTEPQEQEQPPVFVAPTADDEPAQAEPVAEETENDADSEAEADAEETPAPSSEPEPAVEPEPSVEESAVEPEPSVEEPEPVEESELLAEAPAPEPAEEVAPAESAVQEPEPELSEAEPESVEVATEADDAAVPVPEDGLTEERVSQEIDKRKITRRSLFEGFVVGVVTTLIVTFFAYRLYLTKGYIKEAEPAVEQPIAQGELTDTVADAQPALAQTAAEAKAEQQKAEAEQQQKAAEEKKKAEEEQKKKAEAEKTAAAPAGGGTTDTIRSGTNLYRMSRKHYGSDKYWVYIYEENKAKYPNPNAIPVGAVLRVPRLEKYGVKAGDAASLKAAKAKQAEIFNHLNKQ